MPLVKEFHFTIRVLRKPVWQNTLCGLWRVETIENFSILEGNSLVESDEGLSRVVVQRTNEKHILITKQTNFYLNKIDTWQSRCNQ